MCISFQVIILSRQETSMTSQSQPGNELLTNFVGSVVYNRAPKCASTTMRRIIIQLSRHEEALFKLHLESKPFIKQKLNLTEQEELVHSWSVLPTPTIFIRHLHYIDFTRFGYIQPSYINVIREPVARYVSAYYFNRFGFVGWGDTKVKKWLPGMTDEKRYM
uniref:Uncharacterized protein n=1 Tax=Ciona savignyi TaxID=51511 RepID=H2ZHU6_CIOSA